VRGVLRMQQLKLFEGEHVPLTMARQALARGDVEGAGHALRRGAGDAEALDAARLEALGVDLHGSTAPSPNAVHASVVRVLGAFTGEGCLGRKEWFELYARLLHRAFTGLPGRRFRGWLGAHFAWAVGDAESALDLARALVATEAAGPEWLEAARIAFAAGRLGEGKEWLRRACLGAPVELRLEAPPLEPCGLFALDGAPQLPDFPEAIQNLWSVAAALDLHGALTPWIAVLGEIDRVFAPAERSDAQESSAVDDNDLDVEWGPHAFLSALRAARRARARDGARRPDLCSDRELRARRRMQRISPPLLARYLHGLTTSLMP
jgi:hypothetical protein